MYKKWPSSSSSVQVVSKLVHMLCTNWALAWAHVYISKQFPSLGTLSVTAWTQLVHICEQVSFQVGHSNFYSSGKYTVRSLIEQSTQIRQNPSVPKATTVTNTRRAAAGSCIFPTVRKSCRKFLQERNRKRRP